MNHAHSINHRRRRAAALAIALACAIAAYSGTPVLTKFQIQGGPRGLAFLLEADAPFGLRIQQEPGSAGNGPVVKLQLSKVLYGLNDFMFTSFPPGCAVKKVVVTENAKNSFVELYVKLSVSPAQEIRLKQKNNQWLALITSQACPEFAWGAVKGSAAAEPAASPAPRTAPPAVAPMPKASAASPSRAAVQTPAAVPTPAARKTVAAPAALKTEPPKSVPEKSAVNAAAAPAPPPQQPASLLEARLLQRGTLQRVALIFDRPAIIQTKRESNQIIVIAENSVSSLKDAKVVFDTSYGFKSMSTAAVGAGKTKNLRIVIAMRSKKGVVLEHAGNRLAFSIPAGYPPRLAVWNATRRSGMSYAFVQAPAAAPGPQAASPVPVATPAVTPPPAVTWLVVIKDDVNLRSEPSSASRDNVIRKLPLGTMGMQVKKQGGWIRFHTPEAEGWIGAGMVQDSAKVPAAVWLKIAEKQKTAAMAPTAQSPEMPEQQRPPDSADAGSEAEMADQGQGTGMIEYRVYGRDPFLPLSRDEFGDDELGKVEDMVLVGTLIDQFDRLALLEDKVVPGKAYALREGDAVKHGRVLRIMPDNIVFLLNEFGFSKTFMLKLRKGKNASAIQSAAAQENASPSYAPPPAFHAATGPQNQPPSYPQPMPNYGGNQPSRQGFRPIVNQPSSTAP